MCSSDDSFLADDIFYANALHILTAIEVPVHLLGAYIVLAKTPLKMSSVKQSMITLHLAGALYDIYLSCIAIPVFTLPFCAGYPLGLSVPLGIRTDVQVYLGFCFISTVTVAIMSFFEDRYYVLGNGTNRQRNWKRRVYILFHYALSYLFPLPAYWAIPDQTIGKLAILQGVPCFPSELLSRPGFFVLALDSTICLICIASMIALLSSQIVFYAIAIAWKLSDKDTSKSKITNRMQRQFMIALSIQIIIPVAVMFIPSLYITISAWRNYYNQAATNLAFIALSCHGVASTVTMLIVHRPYRDAVSSIFHINKTERTPKQGSNIWKTGVDGARISI